MGHMTLNTKTFRIHLSPVREHPELEISYLRFCEHVEKMCRVCKMDIIITASVHKEIVHIAESINR